MHLPPQPLYGAQDNGMNVLLDHAHQFQFFTAWEIPPLIREGGFRVVGSQATLETVLVPGQPSHVRLEGRKYRPFGTVPNPIFNVLITYQNDPHAQAYLPEEIDAVREFVQAGGGVLLMGGGIHGAEDVALWPLNTLARAFDANITDTPATAPFAYEGAALTKGLAVPESVLMPGLALADPWETLLRSADGTPILGCRMYGKGRIVLLSELSLLQWQRDESKQEASRRAKAELLHALLHWLAAGKPAVGGSRNLPAEAWGGGAIYPEHQVELGGIRVWHAKNQKESSLQITSEAMPEVKAQLEAWLPSVASSECMHLILASGGGGGWAVNVYEPKEVGIIALDAEGILSVFAHELAHTMAGPPNDHGEVAGQLPWLFSEAHAGWFQGKIEALRTGERKGHDPNRLFEWDPDGTRIDLAGLREDQPEHNHQGWVKLWWVWQRLDETYGPTWYPRWLWVKSMRWRETPEHRLSWDEVVEDMSLATGEDLFPFFGEIGTTLDKSRFAAAEFLGTPLELPVARIGIRRTGPPKLDAIRDYRLPLTEPMSLEAIQGLLDERLPYFRVQPSDDGDQWHLLYNGETISAEQWSSFEQFTGAIGFPLDFSSSLYVGVSVSEKHLLHILRQLQPSV